MGYWKAQYFNSLTPGVFAKNAFLDILEILSLEMGQINTDLLKKDICIMTACLSFY